MSSSGKKQAPLIRLRKQLAILEEIPNTSKIGFLNIADHMGAFSASFAAGSSRATTIRERIGMDDKELGLTPVQENLNKIYREMSHLFKSFEDLVDDKSTFTKNMEAIAEWGMRTEQDVFLPPMVDQIREQGSEALEKQTLAAIIDSLLRQTHPLISEIVAASLEAGDVVNHLIRRIVADLDASNHSLSVLRNNTAATLEEMSGGVHKMDTECAMVEAQAQAVNNVIFEMVQAMQYDDIASQRLAHVAAALHKVATVLSSEEQASETNKRWLALTLRICCNQLQEISTEVINAVVAMHDHLTQISDMAEGQKSAISQARNTSIGLRRDTAEITYHLNVLLRLGVFDEGLSSVVLRTLSQAENAVFQTNRALEMLMMITSRLEKLISGLNAGDNGRLDTLSRSVADLTHVIRLEGSKRTKDLAKSADLLNDISMNFSERVTPQLMRTNSMLRRLPLTLKQVDTANNDIRNLMSENLAETQSTFIQVMLLTAEMTFHGAIETSISNIIENLQDIMTDIVGSEMVHALDGNMQAMVAEFEDLAKMYTMASERRVHDAALGDISADEGHNEDDFELF